ncbi:uncharacterized protein LOC127502163 [Ctenopharyngodon idella]|uniref:uncharacterized protein LOC127502163 n=1 Tax=Ctenopharyngodon idella TaxID=7959 RepID=UPI002230F1A5|nr:uncharacterized protein LOC127502163 [Ctenopharyngodon idella]
MMTVVATTTKTWPTVPPSSTTLLDRRCRPKATDETRVMFSFGVSTCGTRLLVGEGYIVYENEVVSDGGAVTDQESAITRESKFRLTVRCFYPLDSVQQVFTSRLFEGPGFGPQGNLISSHAASVFEPKPWPNKLSYNQIKPDRGCCAADKEVTQFLLPHPAYTSERGYDATNVPYPYRRTQLKESGVQFTPQKTIIKHNSGPSMTHAGQQDFFDGLFEDYKSFLVDVPQKTMKRSGLNQDNYVISPFYKGSKNASHIVNETLPSFLQSLITTTNPTNYNLNSNEVSDQLYLRENLANYTPDSGFQHSSDHFNELINNLPSKDSLLYTKNIISNKSETSKSEWGQKHLKSYILPTFNMKSKSKLAPESSAQPLGEFRWKNEGLVAGEHNFMHEDNDYNPKKLPIMHTQQQKEVEDGHFRSDHKLSTIKPSYDKLRGTLFFPGKRSRYGSSIHKGIIRG